MQPGTLQKEVPFVLTRDTTWHRTPSLFYKQENNSVLLILTSNITEHVNIHIIGSLVKRGCDRDRSPRNRWIVSRRWLWEKGMEENGRSMSGRTGDLFRSPPRPCIGQ